MGKPSMEDMEKLQRQFEEAKKRLTAAAGSQQTADEPPAVPSPAVSLVDTLLDCAESAFRKYRCDTDNKGSDYGNYPWWFCQQCKGTNRFRELAAADAADALQRFYRKCRSVVDGKEPEKSERQQSRMKDFIARLRLSRDNIGSPEDLRSYVAATWEGIEYIEGENPIHKAASEMLVRGYLEAHELRMVEMRKGGELIDRDGAANWRQSERDCGKIQSSYLEAGSGDTLDDAENKRDVLWDHWFGEKRWGNGGTGLYPMPSNPPITRDAPPETVFRFMLWELATILARADPGGGYRVTMFLGQDSVAKALSHEGEPISGPTAYRYVQSAVKDGLLRRCDGVKSKFGSGRRIANEYRFDPYAWMVWWSRKRLAKALEPKGKPSCGKAVSDAEWD
jgi:hypothetical protein